MRSQAVLGRNCTIQGLSATLRYVFPFSLPMTSRLSSIFSGILVFLVAAFNIFAGVMKFMPVPQGSPAEAMMAKLGISSTLDHALGVLELTIVLLFLIPRTSTVGLILMIGYMGGALATNLTHGLSNMEALPIYVIFLFLIIIGWIRNPELTSRLRGR